jgi:prolyl-tRNA synthetase
MRYSRLLIPTLKEAPAEAQVVSHILLIRAGYIRKIAAGVYTLLPLGMRVVHKIQKILREELTKSGACEVLPPFVQPAELWVESGRWQKYGPELLRFKDRKGADFVLAPTAEEAFCEMVRRDVKSYRQLPLNLFQIQDKFRDEMRPRAGLMRGREFIMKDGYSFHVSVEDAHREYRAMYDTYHAIFRRCGLDFRAVEADTGAIGGNMSHEFQVLADSGEDALVSCDKCNYAANVEKAELRRDAGGPAAAKDALTVVSTPNAWSIEDVSKLLARPSQEFIKTLVYVADGKPIIACVRGDRDVNELKLKAILKADALALADDSLVTQVTSAKVGYAGPHGVTRKIPIYADLEVAQIASAITGANQADAHVTGLNLQRDCPEAHIVDLRTAAGGDRCARCEDGVYQAYRGIEVGHVFYLGTRYSTPMKVNFLDADGKDKPMEMGCYGIGVTRIAAAAIEQNHDADGIKWPMALAPFHVEIVTAGKEPELASAAEQIERELEARGIEVLYDDRDERAGGKFKDADLLGVPLRVTVGKRGLAEGKVEYKRRGDKDASLVPLAEIVGVLDSAVKAALAPASLGARP